MGQKCLEVRRWTTAASFVGIVGKRRLSCDSEFSKLSVMRSAVFEAMPRMACRRLLVACLGVAGVGLAIGLWRESKFELARKD